MRTSARAPAHLSACLRGAERPHDLPPHPQQRPQPSICPSAVLPSDKEEALGEGPATSVAPTPVRYQREQNQHLQLPALPPHPLTSSVSRPSPLALPREERKESDGGGAGAGGEEQQEAIRVPGDAPGPGPGTTHLHHTDGPSPGRGSQESDRKRPALGKKQHEQPSTDRGREVSASGWGEPRRQLAPRMGRRPCEVSRVPPALLCPGAALTHARCPWSSCLGPSNLRKQGWEEEPSGSTPRGMSSPGATRSTEAMSRTTQEVMLRQLPRLPPQPVL